MIKIDLKNASLSVLKALALSVARDIDRGQSGLRDFLEEIMSFAKGA